MRLYVGAASAGLALIAAGSWALMQPADETACAGDGGFKEIAACTRILDGSRLDATARSTALSNRAIAYFAAGNADRGMADFDAAVAANPGNPAVWLNRAIGNLRNNRPENAVADYTKAIELHPANANAFATRGAVLAKLGRTDDALADLNQAVALDPRFFAAFFERANIRAAKKDWAGVIGDTTKAVEIEPRHAAAYKLRASAHAQQGKADLAIADFTNVIALAPNDVESLLNRAALRDHLGAYEDAVADYGLSLAAKPALVIANARRGIALIKLGRPADALADLDIAAKASPQDTGLLRMRSVAHNMRGDHPHALADLTTAAALSPQDLALAGGIGLTRFYMGQFEAAATALGEVFDRSPAPIDLLFRYLAAQRAGGAGQAQAKADLETGAALFGDAAWPATAAGLYLGKLSPQDLLEAAKSDEQRCEAQFYIGQWHLLKADTASARTAFQAAADRCPKSFIEAVAASAELKRLAQ